MLGIVVILCVSIICLFYYYLTAPYNFWKKLNIPGPSPTLFFGTMKDVILCKTSFWDYLKKVYDTYENTPFVGLFDAREPILMIKDPEHVKDVFIKDAAIFHSRGNFPSNLRILESFFYLNGTVAQPIRSKISSVLTPSKLKDMFSMMLKSMERLDSYLEELLPKNDHVINCTDMAFKLTTDMVGNTLVGIDMQILTNDTTEGNEILTFCNMMHGTYWSNWIRTISWRISPQLCYWIDHYVLSNAKTTQRFVDFIFNIMKHREKHGIVQSDLISAMMELKENRKYLAELLDVDITDEFIASQVYIIFYAAYESSGLTICNTLYELALNQNIQDRLREEIRDVYARNNNELKIENINAMAYLNAVYKETIRKYPPAASIQRQASSSYTFRNTNVTVSKNQKVVIPLHAFQYDPKIFPQPEIYDPERFMGETVQPVHPIYFSPFGNGPRNCIDQYIAGERLGIFQIKIALTVIVHNYKLDVCENTVTSFPHRTTKLINVPDVDIFLKMTKIN